MRWMVLGLMLLAAMMIIGACSDDPESAATPPGHEFPVSGVPYPDDYRADLVHYATIDRIDGTIRDLFISPAALDAARNRRALPSGTVIVVEARYAQQTDGDYQQDESGHWLPGDSFAQIHVAHKRSDWDAGDYVSDARSGSWNFGSFDVASGQPFDENTESCFHCHNPMSSGDFVYTYDALSAYARTGEVQYLYCDLAARLPC